MKPYVYLNASARNWFEGRMVMALAANGVIKEAYDGLHLCWIVS
ncbi:hypothetical protein [Chitinophaga sancti]